MGKEKFDYGYTCPIIDNQLSRIGDRVNAELIDLIDSVGLNHNDFMDVINNYTDYIIRHLEDCFEDVRECNLEMRKEAERQISDLEYDKEIAEDRVRELESDILLLERERDDLECEVDDLECEINDLKSELNN